MPIVLVVDDSRVDRLLVGKLLEKEGSLDWVITYAENGEAALALMEDVVPHVVVTDLIMPGMDGLEFVGAVRVAYPHVPVILITGQGSETLAIDALERGAASYVPKGEMADKLLDTVKQVLAVARADRSYQRLSECIVQNRLTLRLDNDPALIASVVDHIQQLLARMSFCDATERVHLGVALEEALLNALCHGNLALTAEQARLVRSELSQGQSSRLVLERQVQPPYRDRKIHVDAVIGQEEARFVIRDEGAGCARSAVPERGDPRTLERRAGRGLVLLRNFMDEVTFNDAGNEVTLVKKRRRAAVVRV
jgi:CheY-like chemotaxis protein/anti-sigma regulatory factor (Ser/Thr protein kinase)